MIPPTLELRPQIPAAPTSPPLRGPDLRSPDLERLLTEQEQLELDRRAQEALERQGAAAGKD